MKDSKLATYALINSVSVFIYTAAVVTLINNAEKIFGPNNPGSFWGPVALLLLFVLSATVVGALVLIRPAYLYFSGLKTEAVKLLIYTIGWMFAITAIVFIGLIVRK